MYSIQNQVTHLPKGFLEGNPVFRESLCGVHSVSSAMTVCYVTCQKCLEILKNQNESSK